MSQPDLSAPSTFFQADFDTEKQAYNHSRDDVPGSWRYIAAHGDKGAPRSFMGAAWAVRRRLALLKSRTVFFLALIIFVVFYYSSGDVGHGKFCLHTGWPARK